MRVLVTGATGLVGGALCPLLLAAGHEVIAAVRDLGSPKIPDGVTPRLEHDAFRMAYGSCSILLILRKFVVAD